MKTLFGGVLLSLSSTIAQAADWQFVAISEGEIQGAYFVDADSVTYYTSYPYIKNFWALINFSQHKTTSDDKIYRSKKIRYEINCRSRKINLISSYNYTDFKGGGNVVNSFRFDNPSWEDVIPDTIADFYLKFVCSEKDFSGPPTPPPPSYPKAPQAPSSIPAIGTTNYQTTINTAVSRYASGENSDLSACMQNKMNIYVRRLSQKDPTNLTSNSIKIIDSATKATLKTCRAEANAYHTSPSYDCTKATIPTEFAICDTPELRKMDIQFSNAVAAAKVSTPYRQVITENLKVWIKTRNQCLSDTECIKTSYQAGMTYIENL